MNEERSLKSMQQEVDAYIQQFKVGYFSPLAQMARLTEEVGELAREVNHSYGEKSKKATEPSNSVAEELGDVLFVTMIMANSLDIDLTTVFEKNMAKFNQRDHHRFARKDDEQTEDRRSKNETK
ncbi:MULTISPECIES: nucleotide pyrophosphohydrolase [Enterococcus]|uniref:MazG nucleotide pyrophosphohydrolase n=1 Tax=Candidatus Enterococcus mangumiae TaxID=2230878 RepID=A0ABZ2SYF1_9ENTE|nr:MULTISPECIES: nucleotide pyrophosphohydrolase [unclassified Enterococcus]MBO0462548.1 nucleotide pyrophosphohydrolase [Enterococcus sp. DIV1298c]MBO0490642.1 nucleotide pyrophosphohydrolase [Enterococcus sp. DIV1094]MBO1301159.1 nucleotide pyrophosphohydrolase [Enterococcus sp. DIV1271a]